MRLTQFIAALTLAAAAFPAVALNVFACEPEWAALAEELGGKHVNADSATNPLQDPHHIQARPSLIAKVRGADLVICTGAELEIGWLPALLQRGNNPRVRPGQPGHITASDYVQMKGVPDTVDRARGDVHASGNPHIQMDPRNLLPVAQALAERLARLDSAHAQEYQTRHEDFARRWQTAINDWQTRAAPLQDMPIAVHHKTWLYLEDWLGLNKIAELEPKPGVQPSVAHLQTVLSALEAQPAQAIIRAPYFSARASEWLAERTGTPALVLPTTVGGTDQASNLFAMYDDIITQLLAARNKAQP